MMKVAVVFSSPLLRLKLRAAHTGDEERIEKEGAKEYEYESFTQVPISDNSTDQCKTLYAHSLEPCIFHICLL